MSKKRDKKDRKKSKPEKKQLEESQAKELFRALPYRSEDDKKEEEEEEEVEIRPFACITYIPEISHPLLVHLHLHLQKLV